MTERLLGEPGPKRRRRMRLLPLLMLLAAILLIVASQASGAFGTPTIDENGPNDVPGQKDLNSHNIDDSGLPNSIKVQWNWDELGTSGANSLDACALLDSDGDGFANFAACETTTGNPAVELATTLYSCGDTRVDRCSSQLAVIANPTSTCEVAQSATDPFPGPAAKNKGAGYPNDTQATCTINLADFGVTVTDLELINTCSYPSQQPNSDPSDCVLVPRDATLKIVKDAGADTTTDFDFEARVNTSGSNTQVLETITGSGEVTVPIIGGKPNSVEELTLPAGWDFSTASCTGGTNNGTLSAQKISGIVAATATTVTCTFTNLLALSSPSAGTAPFVIPQDTVTISGFDNTGSQDGTLSVQLHASSDCTDTTPAYAETFTVTADGDYVTTNDGVAANNGFKIDSSNDGTYYWRVAYDGDSRNNGFGPDCNESVLTTITDSP